MLNSPFQHHGLDWVAMALTFFAIYSLGNKQRRGFVIMMAGNTCWIILAFKFQSLGMIAANAVFCAMNLRGFICWSREAAQA
ncbi:MAG: nicotinamide mononucleotide transporter [Opitutaceae bacterium]|nr:nicotinamide mononucleotide transporter [Opitutaceae bacterium]